MTIHDIEEKISNDGATPKGQLTAEEFNTVVSTVVKHEGEIPRSTYWDMVNSTQYCFASDEERDRWLEGDTTVVPSMVTKFQFAGKQQLMNVINKMGSTNIYFAQNQETAIITVGFSSQEKDITASEWSDVFEDAFFTVYVDRGATGVYQEIVSNQLVLSGNDFSMDVKNFLAVGSNRIRIEATGVSSGEVGNLQLSATLTSMFIEPSNYTWYTPFVEGTTYNLGGFRIGGNLTKYLKIKVAKEGYESPIYETYLGTATYLTTAYIFRGLEFPEAGSGVYNVECWLDANGLESNHLSHNIIFVSEADKFTAQFVAISNVSEKVYNFADNALFEYCIYNGGQSFGSPHIKLSSIVSATPTTIIDETLSNVLTNKALTCTAALEVELQDENLEITLDATMTYGNEQEILFAVDNSKSYPATTGAVFYLNPATRNNSQENREVVINGVNSAEYAATFNRMAWTDGVDGWTTDESGRKCLRLPAMSSMEFAYQPLSSVNSMSGKTIEFVYKVKNVADYDDPIITICDDVTSPSFRGIKITPKNILIHSRDEMKDSLQDYNTNDEETLHVVITLIYKYKEVYGNLAQIFVNGTKVRSFSFQDADRWNVDSIVKLGNDTSDFFLYKMRVYERGFDSADAIANYINSLPSTKDKEQKKAECEAPMGISDTLNYDDCVKNGLNTMVIEILGNDQNIPSIAYPTAKQSNVWITINNPIDGELDEDFATLFSGTPILNQTIEGQGTTAMTYARWNFRWKLDKTYNKRRITAKKNFASSMHSHKMGATRLFNDLNKRCVGANDAGKRTAVFQYSVYGFQKILREGTTNVYDYIPIGLYTIGPDKGDKETFGFNDERFEDTLIHMEGTDHTPLGVGMDYPWNELVYSAANEGFGAVNASNAVVTAWEVGAAGPYEVGQYQEVEDGPILDDSEEVRALLDVEFKPAYNVAYFNSPFIEGVTETLAQINANPSSWQANSNAEGVSYAGLEFWTDGVYDLYFYNTKTQKYENVKNDDGTNYNLLSDLSLTTSDVSGLTVAEKNELFKQLRRERFAANWGEYWDTQDAIFHYAFVAVFGATDNFKKNTYPYKFKTFADGGKYRWRQDDLDTLFDINNQGLAAKTYSILVGDKTSTGSGSIYRGDNSAFWTLIKETQQDKIKTMIHSIFNAMVELSPYGNNTLDKIVGCIRYYFWDKAQNYFPATAYNIDAEWTYEDTWAAKQYKEVNPLSQSLGGHYEAERDWVAMRVLFAASYYNYGPFDSGKTAYSDTSTGQIAYGGAGAHTFSFVPAIDFNPTILRGQSEYMTVGDRIKAGETVELTVPTSTGADTRIYVQGVDWMEDIGDLSNLEVTADNATLTIGSKRLQRIKIGDEDASKVTSNISEVEFSECPSVMVVDARNLSSLGGSIDLSLFPRLLAAYFGGTRVTSIAVPNGSKIETLELSPEMTQLTLQNLKFMESSGLLYDTLDKVEFLRIEGCDQLNPFAILKLIYNADNQALRDIRIVGFDATGDANDLAMISNMVKDLDKNGNAHIFNGIDQSGKPVDDTNPVIEGKLEISSGAYEDDVATLKGAYPNLVLNILGGVYIKFEDDKVRIICAEKWGDGIGLTIDALEEITSVDTAFRGNTEIRFFDEFSKFVNVTSFPTQKSGQMYAFGKCTSLESIVLPPTFTYIGDGNRWYGSGYCAFDGCTSLKNVTMPESLYYVGDDAFYGCTSLEEIDLSNVKYIGEETFSACTNLKKIYSLEKLETLMGYAFKGCTALAIDVNMPKLQNEEIKTNTFDHAGIIRVVDLGKASSISNGQGGIYGNNGAFYQCKSLISANLQNIVHIGDYAFRNCTALESLVLSPNVTRIGIYSFGGCTALKGVYDFSKVVEFGQYAFSNCILEGAILRDATIIDKAAFRNNKTLVIESLNLPNLTQLGDQAFQYVQIKRIDNLGSITSWDYSSNTSSPYTFREAPLEFLRIPSTMTVLQNTAFYNVTTTPTVVCEATTPPTLNGTTGIPQNASVIYVPCASIPSYKAATNWTTYADRIGPLEDYEDGGWVKFEDSAVEAICVANWDTNGSGYMSENEVAAVTSIGTIFKGNTEITSFDEFEKFTGVTSLSSRAFTDCTSLTSITIPRNVTKFDSQNDYTAGTFSGCTSLTTLTFESDDTLLEIGQGCFANTPNIVNCKFPKSVTTIGQCAFRNSFLKVVDFPALQRFASPQDFQGSPIERVENIGKVTAIPQTNYEPFFGGSITFVRLPETMQTIGYHSFYGVKKLTTFICEAITPPSLNASAFTNASTSAITFYVPDASVDAYKAATNWATYAAQIKPLSEYNG